MWLRPPPLRHERINHYIYCIKHARIRIFTDPQCIKYARIRIFTYPNCIKYARMRVSTDLCSRIQSTASFYVLLVLTKWWHYFREKILTLPTPCISESCIKIKTNLIFFHTSLWCLKMFYEGLYSLLLKSCKMLIKRVNHNVNQNVN